MADQSKRMNIACKTCGQLYTLEPLAAGTVAICRRCGVRIAKRTMGSLHMTAAFALAALILYIPANVFPILQLNMYGAISQNTVWEGTVRLFKDGDNVIATIVLLASIVVPLLKLLGLLILVVSTQLRVRQFKHTRTWIHRMIDAIGRWAMLDVFVVAILVSLVKLQRLATILPGPGLLAFSLVVVCTIFASASFDSELIWEDEELSA